MSIFWNGNKGFSMLTNHVVKLPVKTPINNLSKIELSDGTNGITVIKIVKIIIVVFEMGSPVFSLFC